MTEMLDGLLVVKQPKKSCRGMEENLYCIMHAVMNVDSVFVG